MPSKTITIRVALPESLSERTPAQSKTASCQTDIPVGPVKALAEKIDRYRPDTSTRAGRAQARKLKLRADLQPFYREQRKLRAQLADCHVSDVAALAARLVEVTAICDAFRARIREQTARKRAAIENGGYDGVLAV